MKLNITRSALRAVDESTVTAIMRAVSLRLRREREDRGWTQGEVGQSCGISVSVLCRVELFQRNPSLWLLTRVCLALRVRPSDLLRIAEDDALPLPPALWDVAGNSTLNGDDQWWSHGGHRAWRLWRAEFSGPDEATVQAQATAWFDCVGTDTITVVASCITDGPDDQTLLTICYEVTSGGPVAMHRSSRHKLRR
jgi:transcriptional regulator with XRE-family HTH domain